MTTAPQQTVSQRPAPGGARVAGDALALFAFDIGFQIDLEASSALVRESTRQRVVRARRPAPVWFDYKPPPLRLEVDGEDLEIGPVRTAPRVEMLIYDFGAALLTYRMPLPDDLADLPRLSVALYDNERLIEDAKARVMRIMDAIRPAIERPKLSDFIEDYAIFAVRSWPDGAHPETFAAANHEIVARALEAETGDLSKEHAERVSSARMSYAPTDLAIVDWNCAILFDEQPDDVIAVLQHANVELLELRVLDQELDGILDHADETLGQLADRRLWPTFHGPRMLRRFASVQTDAAVMFEGVNNAIKLLGNQYLARLYRLTAQRLDLPAWQASVQRKLGATDSLYQKMSDAAATRRLETLEWVIIALIFISILLMIFPVGGGH